MTTCVSQLLHCGLWMAASVCYVINNNQYEASRDDVINQAFHCKSMISLCLDRLTV
jgi:hypothetical protein